MGGESGSSTPGFCNSDFPKLANNATTVANAAILTKRSINATNLSFGRAGGSGTGSGLKDLIRRSRCSSSDQRGVDVEVPTQSLRRCRPLANPFRCILVKFGIRAVVTTHSHLVRAADQM